jgi:hypothetical protein
MAASFSRLEPTELTGQIHEELAHQVIPFMLEDMGVHTCQ